MSFNRWNSARVSQGIALALALVFSVVLLVLVNAGTTPRVAAETKAGLAATIFDYDGKEFVRTQTTLKTEKGKSAVKTTLDHGAAYKFLSRKESYTGDVTVFGHNYEGHYAPVVSGDGRLIGALFVGIPK
jgi:methyl-accepting chemotaxis protein